MAPSEVEPYLPDDAGLVLFEKRKHVGTLSLGLRVLVGFSGSRLIQQPFLCGPLAFAPFFETIGSSIAPDDPPGVHAEPDGDILAVGEALARIEPLIRAYRVAEQQHASIARVRGDLLSVRHEPEMAMHVVERRHLPALLKKSATLY